MHVRAAAACAVGPPCSSTSHMSDSAHAATRRHPHQMRHMPSLTVPLARHGTCCRRTLAAAATQKDREAAHSGTEPQETERQGGILQNLASSLLRGAASRLERGTTTCLKCRGTGTVACTACKGHGVLEKTQMRMKTAGRISNRCSKCGGSGRTACTVCKGRGFRGDVFEE